VCSFYFPLTLAVGKLMNWRFLFTRKRGTKLWSLRTVTQSKVRTLISETRRRVLKTRTKATRHKIHSSRTNIADLLSEMFLDVLLGWMWEIFACMQEVEHSSKISQRGNTIHWKKKKKLKLCAEARDYAWRRKTGLGIRCSWFELIFQVRSTASYSYFKLTLEEVY
jgi:hypothetical protein